jgi:hypothetical protein
MAKKPKFKIRRKLDRRDLFKKKVAKEDPDFARLDEGLKETFPDPKDRYAYINALIEGLEHEPNLEILP